MTHFSTKKIFKRISEHHKQVLYERISQDEIKDVNKQLINNKAAGPDGDPAEFFKTFMKTLLPILDKTFNAILLEGIMPQTWNEAVLIPIPTPGKNKTLCQLYSPIALLNVDMMIFSTILARGLEKIIPQYINPDQTDFIPTSEKP